MPELTPERRQETIEAVHDLVCRRHLSIRRVRTELAARGIRRSLAQIHADLHGQHCDRCQP